MKPSISKQLLNFALLLLITVPLRAATSAPNFDGRPDEWFSSPEGKQTITNIISWQTAEGGWAKGYKSDQLHKAGEGFGEWNGLGTIDNGYTHTELRLLARAYNLTKRQDALDAFNRGVDYLISSQFPNGGFPQRFPLPKDYGRHITLNDNAMVHVMEFLEDISEGKPEFAFVDAARRERATKSFDLAIDFILKSQLKSNGKLTGWAQQYDAQTLQPAIGRTYELQGIATDETSGVLILLMRQDNPSPAMKNAIHAGVAWLEASKITGLREEKRKNDAGETDVFDIKDPAAPPLWSRFYEIDTNRPFYCGRDGVKKYSISDIERERRVGYAWHRPWGSRVLTQYAKWNAKHQEKSASAPAK